MRKRRVMLGVLLLAVAGVVGVLVSGALREREPEYGGKRLSEWVMEMYPSPSNSVSAIATARLAISDIGTNAIPYLLRWIRYEPRPWRDRLYAKVNPVLKCVNARWELSETRKESLAYGALLGFGILGTQARGAVGELAGLANDPSVDWGAKLAMQALARMGEAGLPPLLVAAQNPPCALQVRAISNLGDMGTNARPSIPLLIKFLKARDEGLAAISAQSLGLIGLEAKTVVPALSESLSDRRDEVRIRAIVSLGQFGTEARSATRGLSNCSINDPWPVAWWRATNALRLTEALEEHNAR